MFKPTLQCSLLYFYIYIWLGMLISSFGPSLLSLSRQTNTLITTITLMITTRSAGGLLGSLISYFFGSRIDIHKWLGGIMSFACVGLLGVPLSFNLTNICLCMIPIGITIGICDSNITSLLFGLHDFKVVDPFVQALHGSFGVGSVIFPFIVGVALEKSGGYVDAAFYVLAALPIPAIIGLFYYPTPTAEAADYYDTHSLFTSFGDDKKVEVPPKSTSDILAIFFSSFFLFNLFVCYNACGLFLVPFAVATPAINFSEVDASNLAGIFWGAVAAGRVISVLMSNFSTSLQILTTLAVFGITGLSTLVALGSTNVSALYVGAILFGVACGPAYASIFTYCKSYVNIDPNINSMFVIGASLGELSSGISGAYLFELSPTTLWILCLIAFCILVSCYNIIYFICTPINKAPADKIDSVEMQSINSVQSPTQD